MAGAVGVSRSARRASLHFIRKKYLFDENLFVANGYFVSDENLFSRIRERIKCGRRRGDTRIAQGFSGFPALAASPAPAGIFAGNGSEKKILT